MILDFEVMESRMDEAVSLKLSIESHVTILTSGSKRSERLSSFATSVFFLRSTSAARRVDLTSLSSYCRSSSVF